MPSVVTAVVLRVALNGLRRRVRYPRRILPTPLCTRLWRGRRAQRVAVSHNRASAKYPAYALLCGGFWKRADEAEECQGPRPNASRHHASPCAIDGAHNCGGGRFASSLLRLLKRKLRGREGRHTSTLPSRVEMPLVKVPDGISEGMPFHVQLPSGMITITSPAEAGTVIEVVVEDEEESEAPKRSRGKQPTARNYPDEMQTGDVELEEVDEDPGDVDKSSSRSGKGHAEAMERVVVRGQPMAPADQRAGAPASDTPAPPYQLPIAMPADDDTFATPRRPRKPRVWLTAAVCVLLCVCFIVAAVFSARIAGPSEDVPGGTQCTCPGGGCDQEDCNTATCDGGYCSQARVTGHASCNGGVCDQRCAHSPSCNGGVCDQTAARNPSCDGGDCDHSFARGEVSCFGGGCYRSNEGGRPDCGD